MTGRWRQCNGGDGFGGWCLAAEMGSAVCDPNQEKEKEKTKRNKSKQNKTVNGFIGKTDLPNERLINGEW